MMTDKDKAMEALEKVWQDWADSHKTPPHTMTLGDTRHLSFEMRKAVFFGYEAGLSARIPDGWQLVPVEPDMSMELSGQSILKDEFGYAQRQELVRLIYKAMIAAAPKPEGE